jgi:hypothetical protein
MTKFVHVETKAEVYERIGRDWYKIVKVDGGYAAFETRQDYETWRKQK